MKKIFWIFFLSAVSTISIAAQKPLSYVATKLASQNVASGLIQVENELKFADGTSVRENIFVRNSNEMAYEASTTIANKKIRWSGNFKTRPLEGELFLRDDKVLLKRWVSMGFAGADVFEKHTKPASPHEEFVRLVRLDGLPHYEIGKKPGEVRPAHAIWIEPNTWQLKKIRPSENEEIEFHRYERFSDTTNFPREWIYRLNDTSEEIRGTILAVRKIAKMPNIKMVAAVDELPASVKKFNQRFR